MEEELRFDVADAFDADYLYFYQHLTPELSKEQTDLIWRLLEIQPGMDVLDLACGHGRISNLLASRGARVTGLDATAMFLDRARAEAAELGLKVDYVEGDMRSLPWDGEFHRVVNWFTSFGYFDDSGNRQVLDQVYRVLVPGGKFLVEIQHRDGIMRVQREQFVVERDGNLLIDLNRFDPLTGRQHAERTIVRDGRVRRFRFFVRLFSFTELRDWFERAGFSDIVGYGEDGEPLNLDHRRMILIGRKPGD
jgi:ubiquinone/menaquinone biosynthesis C-methylase UbiE